MSLGMELGLGPGDFVLNGDPASLPKRGAEPPQFSAHVYCGQTVGWMKLVLGTEIGLGPGDFVLNGEPSPPPKFLAHVYYSYCDFIRTVRKAHSLLVYSSSS